MTTTTETRVEDCIYRRGARYSVRVRRPGGKQVRRSARTLSEAREIRDASRHQLRDNTYTAPQKRNMLMADWIPMHCRAKVWTGGTRKGNELAIAKWITPTFGNLRVSDVTQHDVQMWVNGLVDKGLLPNTIEGYYYLLTNIFTTAIHYGCRQATPCHDIVRPKIDKAVHNVLEADQVVALAENIGERMSLFVWLGAMAGLRIGEILGLTLDRVDFERRLLVIDRQLLPSKMFGPTKSRRTREVPVPDVLLERIRHQVDTYGVSPLGTLFVSYRQAVSHQTMYARKWPRAIEGLELPEDADTPHALRHHYASVLIAAGCNVNEVKERLGHTKISETVDTYGHLFPKAADTTRAAFDGMYQ